MTEQEVKNLIKELDKSAVYNMSLGSKELFHSNFWAWLINKYNKFVGVFFNELKDKAVKVTREEKHCDLTVHLENEKDIYIIENKLKSLPSEAQLLKYQEKNKKTFDKGIITGLIKPDFMLDNELRNWQFMSYSDISKNIREVLKNLSENKKIDVGGLDYKIIDEYCSVIDNVNKLVVNSLDDLNENKNIKDIRLGDICQKLKMAKFADYLKGREEEIKSYAPKNYELEIITDFSEGKALIDIDWIKKNNNDEVNEIDRIGIQIQGNQYRRFIVKNIKMDSKESKDNFFNQYCNNKSINKNWFTKELGNGIIKFNNREERITGLGKTGMKKPYCEFVASKYTMLYQHWDITKNKKCTDYCELTNIIIEDLKTAKEII